MSNGDDPADAPEEADAEEEQAAEDAAEETLPARPDEATEESLTEYLDEIEAVLEAAETEADCDDVEALLDDAEDVLDGADLPEPDEDDDAEDPRGDLEARIGTLRETLEETRGPYASEAIEAVEAAVDTVTETEWTADGHEEVVETVEAFVGEAADAIDDETLDVDDLEDLGGSADGDDGTADSDDGTIPDDDGTTDGDTDAEASTEAEERESSNDTAVSPSIDDLAAALTAVSSGIDDAGLDPDDDAVAIAALLEATDALETGLEDAEEWDDLETNEQLYAQGYYDVLGHYKDYPVEWSALKEHEKRGNVDMVLLALDSLQSDFMERHCLEALERMGKRGTTEESVEVLLGRAGKRDQFAIRILGKMAAEEATETLVEYVDEDSNPGLQKATFKALGEIGAEEAVQPLANKLEMENDHVRPYAARALGLIGDTRAIDPLATALAEDDSDDVRAAAAWALRQIGTEAALEAAAEYVDERVYLVQTEAEKATATLDSDPQSA